MNITLEGNQQEIYDLFGKDYTLNHGFEITVRGNVLVCVPISMDTWSSPFTVAGPAMKIVASAYNKRQQEISEAKALVNKTKEAHKEAQRRLAELQNGEK